MSTEVEVRAERIMIEEACRHHVESIRKARAEGRDIQEERLSEKLNDLLGEWRDAG